MQTVSLVLTVVLVLFLVLVGSLRIIGYAPVRADADGLGIPYAVYRWLGASELLCAPLLLWGLTARPVATAAAAYLAIGAVAALVLHVRAGDPVSRWVGAGAAALLAAAVGLLSAALT